MNVSDFHQDGDEATLRFHVKGGRVKIKGIHFSAAEAISEYIKAAGIESGPLFRPRVSQHSDALAARRITERTMYRILMSYLHAFVHVSLGQHTRKTMQFLFKEQEQCLTMPHHKKADQWRAQA